MRFAREPSSDRPARSLVDVAVARGCKVNRVGPALPFMLIGTRVDVRWPHRRKEAKPRVVCYTAKCLNVAGIKP